MNFENEAITNFRGTVFSNFSIIPGGIDFEGENYPSVEHAYQAAKTLDPNERAKVRKAPTSGKAKALGRKLTLRSDWEEVKIGVMRDLLRKKFPIGTYRAITLMATGDAQLVEVNTWGDRFWGQCPRGMGENWLGKLLMEIRAELLKQEGPHHRGPRRRARGGDPSGLPRDAGGVRRRSRQARHLRSRRR